MPNSWEVRYGEIIRKREEGFSDGHRVQFYVEIDNSTSRESTYVLNQDFFTKCEEHSTSWNLRIFIRTVEVNEWINFPVILKRCDSMQCVVNASINVSLACRGESIYGIPRYFAKSRMLSGDRLSRSINGYPQPPKQRTLFDEKVIILAIVDISGCHGVVDKLHEENFSTPTPSVYFSNQGEGDIFHLKQENLPPKRKKRGIFSSCLRIIRKRKK